MSISELIIIIDDGFKTNVLIEIKMNFHHKNHYTTLHFCLRF